MDSTFGITTTPSLKLSAALLAIRIASAWRFCVMAPLLRLVRLAGLALRNSLRSHISRRVGAVCIIIVMLGAIFLVHLPQGFDIGHGGMEYALTQLLAAFGTLLTGPGAYSWAGSLPASLRRL
jgi:hypothetical protein